MRMGRRHFYRRFWTFAGWNVTDCNISYKRRLRRYRRLVLNMLWLGDHQFPWVLLQNCHLFRWSHSENCVKIRKFVKIHVVWGKFSRENVWLTLINFRNLRTKSELSELNLGLNCSMANLGTPSMTVSFTLQSNVEIKGTSHLLELL